MINSSDISYMALYLERQGFFLTERQLSFCRFMLEYQNSVKAAKAAGFPNPEAQGPEMYIMFRDAIGVWWDHIGGDRALVLQIYRRQAQAVKLELVNGEEIRINKELPARYEAVPHEDLNGKGAKGLRDVLGLDKAKGVDINMSGGVELPATLRDKMDKVYVQSDAHEPVSS